MTKKKSLQNNLQKIQVNPERKTDLSEILGLEQEGTATLANAKLIKIDRIHPNPDQPRKNLSPKKLEELANSIKERGILQPIRVRPLEDGYQIIAGERRWQAAKIAGLTDIPAIVIDQDEKDSYLDALIENILREDLNPLDRADGLVQLRVNLGLHSWEEVGQRTGLTRQHIYHLLGLRGLPKEVQQEIKEGLLTEKHGRALRLLLADPKLFKEAYEQIKHEGLSGDQSLELVRSFKKKSKEDLRELKPIMEMKERLGHNLSLLNPSSLDNESKEYLAALLTDMIGLLKKKLKTVRPLWKATKTSQGA